MGIVFICLNSQRVYAYTGDSDDFSFETINGDTEVKITSAGSHTGDVIIPERIDNLPVTTIADNLFQNVDFL